MVRICVIQGHPARYGGHFCHAMADAYSHAAGAAGPEVRTVSVAEIEHPVLRCKEDCDKGPPAAILTAQQTMSWAEHLVIIHPLWIGALPALLKGFSSRRSGRVSPWSAARRADRSS